MANVFTRSGTESRDRKIRGPRASKHSPIRALPQERHGERSLAVRDQAGFRRRPARCLHTGRAFSFVPALARHGASLVIQ